MLSSRIGTPQRVSGHHADLIVSRCVNCGPPPVGGWAGRPNLPPAPGRSPDFSGTGNNLLDCLRCIQYFITPIFPDPECWNHAGLTSDTVAQPPVAVGPPWLGRGGYRFLSASSTCAPTCISKGKQATDHCEPNDGSGLGRRLGGWPSAGPMHTRRNAYLL